MRVLLRNFVLIIFAVISLPIIAAESPKAILEKSISKISNVNGIKAAFSISIDGSSPISGTYLSKGKKFKLVTPLSTTWFDGKDMWTANNKSRQITLITPTEQEINEVNPFSYLKSYKGKYRIFFSKRSEKGLYLILLNPINSKDQIKAVEIAINAASLLPERFIIRDKNDNRTTVSVNSISLNTIIPDAEFICKPNSLKGYELVDLR